MKFRQFRFNTYLPWVLGAVLAGACHTPDKGKEKSEKKETSVLRLHLEVNADGTDRSALAQIGRQTSFLVNIDKHAFLTEFDMVRAEVVDDEFGGFGLKVQYNQHGTWLLEQYTTANRGKRFAIFAEFGEVRWLAAPRVTKRISDGIFTFTPDATREEAQRIARGLNNAIAKERRKNLFNDPLPK
jgi:preprotein translocase subunit SecD